MEQIKRFHEAPKAMFHQVQKVTDGDYALVHLFEKDPEYLKLFQDAVAAGREVILDNSVFELGMSVGPGFLASWVKRLQPTWYIVPDVLEDAKGTVQSFFNFCRRFPMLPGKRIGVVQGSDIDEMIWCYKQIEPACGMVAFSFDCSWYVKAIQASNKWASMMLGRSYLLRFMEAEGIINTKKPHHLLGVALPQEVALYKNMPWIYSIDTSNPVVHGLKSIRYESGGLREKESQKLIELIDAMPDLFQQDDVLYNIEQFRGFAER